MSQDRIPEVDSIDKLWFNMISTQAPETNRETSQDKKPEVDSIDELLFNMITPQGPEASSGKSQDKKQEVDSIDELWLSLKNFSAIRNLEVSHIEK